MLNVLLFSNFLSCKFVDNIDNSILYTNNKIVYTKVKIK